MRERFKGMRTGLRDFIGGTTQQVCITSLSIIPSIQTIEIKTIAEKAASRYKDVPKLALKLKKDSAAGGKTQRSHI